MLNTQLRGPLAARGRMEAHGRPVLWCPAASRRLRVACKAAATAQETKSTTGIKNDATELIGNTPMVFINKLTKASQAEAVCASCCTA